MDTVTFERVYVASIEQSNAINAVTDKDCKAKDMAGMYADCIIADTAAQRDGLPRVDWHVVNGAITQRWPKGLTRIKTAAWRLLSARRVGLTTPPPTS